MLTGWQSTLGIVYCVLLLSACKGSNDTTTVIPEGSSPKLITTTLVNNHEIIWGMDFLPNGDLLFTEKRGRIYRYTTAGVTEELTGVPAGINTNGQGGLLDIK